MNILVDTSVWVDHFQRRNEALVQLLEIECVLMHPLILLELVCGTPPKPRHAVLQALGQLRQTLPASPAEVLALIEREQLFGQGCGAVDLSLLASTLITPGTRLWTLDRRLDALTRRLGVDWAGPPPNLG